MGGISEKWNMRVRKNMEYSGKRNYCAAAAKSLQSCPTLCDPRDGSPPGSSIPGILQARTLEWVAIAFSEKGARGIQISVLSKFIASPNFRSLEPNMLCTASFPPRQLPQKHWCLSLLGIFFLRLKQKGEIK